MNPRLQVLLISSAALGLLLVLLLLLLNTVPAKHAATTVAPSARIAETASVAASAAGSSTSITQTPLPASQKPKSAAVTTTKNTSTEPKKPSTSPTDSKQPATTEIQRIADAYATAALPFDEVNVKTRQALVNILCMPNRGTLNPISGSGVIIDPRGVILTNAHVAQYVLLSQSREIDLTCMVRTGSPAIPLWRVGVLYLPPVWVKAHVSEINQTSPMGTGEHDYALLSIISNMDGSPTSGPFPYLQADTRNGIGFLNDEVLAAAYPAEFVGGIIAQNNLYPASSVTSIRQLLTFNSGTVDAFSVGGVVEAQAGSSGGAVVNAWNRLIGIISITSSGATTADRDLRAVTLSYINEDLTIQSGKNLTGLMGGDPIVGAAEFAKDVAPALIQQYVAQLIAH